LVGDEDVGASPSTFELIVEATHDSEIMEPEARCTAHTTTVTSLADDVAEYSGKRLRLSDYDETLSGRSTAAVIVTGRLFVCNLFVN